jgi:crossover junction endodeoxyribonuclease RusA
MRITIPGEPVPKQRPRLGKNGTVYTPKQTRVAEDVIRWMLTSSHVRPAEGDVAVFLDFSTSSRRRVDLDNLVKLVLDACNGLAWKDDSQVVLINARLERGSHTQRTILEVIPA